MAKTLTTKSVEAAKPDPVRRIERPDPAFPGLYLVIQSTGVKSWALRYRFGGKPRKLTLGRWPALGVADARRAAAEALDAIEHGQDPGETKKAKKTDLLAAQLAQRDTVAALVEQFATRHLSKLKSGDHARQFIDRFVIPAWGERDVHDISRRDVIDLLDQIVDSGRGTTANRVLAHTRKFFNWCVERDVIAIAPTTGVRPPAKETVRHRVLTDDEVRWFWQACDGEGDPWGSVGKMLLLTGQRLSEVVGMTTDEIDGDTWHLPALRTKNGRAHDVPLSKAAAAILRSVEPVTGSVGYIFTTTGNVPVSGFDKARKNIAARMTARATEERGEPVEIPHWTFHDLRRTAATGMARLGLPVRVTEAVLNHVSGTAAGIVSVYQRYDYEIEKRRALEAWANLLHEIGEDSVSNVVRLEGGR